MDLISKYLKELTMSDESKIKKYVKVAAAIIIKTGENGERLVLLIQRAKDDFFPDFWEVPRGRCDGGETKSFLNEPLKKCLLRETKEETGLDIEPIKFIDKFSYIADNGTRKSTQYNFLCEMKDSDQKVKLSKEHQDFKWVQSVGEVELYVLPEIKKSISKVLNPDEQIVNYPESELVDDKINEIVNL